MQRAEGAIARARAVATEGHTSLYIGYAMSPTVRDPSPALRAFQTRKSLGAGASSPTFRPGRCCPVCETEPCTSPFSSV